MSIIDHQIGNEPPSIQDIVPAPTSTNRAIGLGPSNIQPFESDTPAGLMSDRVVVDVVPDYFSGRGGDGIGGFSMPVSRGIIAPDEGPERRETHREILGRLRRLLGW